MDFGRCARTGDTPRKAHDAEDEVVMKGARNGGDEWAFAMATAAIVMAVMAMMMYGCGWMGVGRVWIMNR